MNNRNKPLLLVLSSPSGAGKTTLSKKIQQSDNTFKISVSHTTRKPRPNEVDGVDYHFVSKNKFEELIKKNEFYEYSIISDILEFPENNHRSLIRIIDVLGRNCKIDYNVPLFFIYDS